MATASEKVGVQFFIDGKAITDTVIAKQGEDWSTYQAISAKTSAIEAGEHVLKMQIVGNYVNVDWFRFCEGTQCEETSELRKITPKVSGEAPVRMLKKGGALYIEKNGMRFDLTGHRIK